MGCDLGFQELLAAGQIKKLPRLFAAQPWNCSPLEASFQAGVDEPVARPVTASISEGTPIASPLRLKEMLAALRSSGGQAIVVQEHEIIAALKRIALQGILPEPTSATALAGLERLIEQGTIKETEETVVLLTGTGIKTTPLLAELYA